MTSSSPQSDTDKDSGSLVLGQSRERKTVDRYVDTGVATLKKPKRQVIAKGAGVPISDMEHVCQRLDRMRGTDDLLKLLHRALYGRPGAALHVKQGIRLWNGLPPVAAEDKDEVDPEAAKQLRGHLKRWLLEPLYDTCQLFGLDVKRNKKDCLDALYTFLCKPWDTDKPTKKRKAKSSTKSESKSKTKKPRKTSKSTSKLEVTGQSDVEEEEKEEEKEQEEEATKVSDDEMEEKKPTAKKSKSTPSTTTKKKTNSKDNPSKTVPSKEKQPSVKTSTTAKTQKSDKQLSKKTLESAIRKIITGSDLETMTPRNVREQLSAKFKQDMTQYKSEIKRIVNDIVMDMVNK
ncbi:hypothetical protein BDF22DRAFT_678915 [Syncephalis plumigaleata]|nr:hypothetical protein BDF22DRAFT_678915 [Syncephalis plumigaleata]